MDFSAGCSRRYPTIKRGLTRGALAAAATLALAHVEAAGQSADPAGGMVASVEIIGSAPLPGLGIDRRLLPYSVQRATSADIRESGSGNLTDFMARNLAGVNVNEITGSPFQSDITYRGFRISPLLGAAQGISLYLDGVRVNEPFGDVAHWDMLPEAALGSILLVPGSNPLYGLNTLGGALAITTKSGRTHPGLDAELSLSNEGRRRVDVAYGMRGARNWHAFVAATMFQDDGWRRHSEGKLGNVFVKLGQADSGFDWNLSLLGGASRLLGNGLLPDYRAAGDTLLPGLYAADRRAVYTFPDHNRNRVTQATLSIARHFDAHSNLSAIMYARNSRRDSVGGDVNDEYGDYVEDCQDGFLSDGIPADPRECGLSREQGGALHPASLNTTATRQRSQGASINFSRRQGRHQVNLGVTFDRSDVRFAQFEQEATFSAAREVLADPEEEREPASSATGRARALGLYASDTWSLTPSTHLTLAARFNHARVSNTLTTERGAQPHESFRYSRLNPALGLAHELGAGFTLVANLSHSNRVPTVIELGCADPAQPCRLPVGLQSDPYLKQVLARTLEAGLRWQAPGAAATFSVYRTVNRDDIQFLTSGPSRLGYFANFERTLHQGAELSANKQFGALAARASYSYLDAVYDAGGELFMGARHVRVEPGTRIAGLPRHSFKLAVEWQASPAWRLGADLQALSNLVAQGNEDGLRADPEEDQPGARADWRIRGHALLNLRAQYRPAPNWELFVRLNNALDRRYQSYGALANDMFPNGQLLAPHESPAQPAMARFVAPGTPRSVAAGLRYRF